MKGTPLQLFRMKHKSAKLGEGPTLVAVAEELDMSAGNLSAIERGDVRLGLKCASKLASFYGVPFERIEYLYNLGRVEQLEAELVRIRAAIAVARSAERKKKAKKRA